MGSWIAMEPLLGRGNFKMGHGMEKEADAIPDCVYHSYLRDLLVVASGTALQRLCVFS